MGGRHGKPPTLRRRQDFVRVQRTGRRFVRANLALLIATNSTESARVGYTISRKVGNAVVRNRVRRRLREIVRHQPDLHLMGVDYVFIAFTAAASAEFHALFEDVTWLLEQAQAWVSSRRSLSS